MKRAVEQMGVRRTAQTLPRLNQVDGFDCQGCAWPDPDPSHRHTAEFCENGAKAVDRGGDPAPRRPRASSPTHSVDGPRRTGPTTGSASRAGSPSRWCCAPAPPTTSRSPGTRRSRLVAGHLQRPRLARRGGLLHLGQDLQRGGVRLPALRPAPSAPTTCPTAPTCATSRRRSALAETIGIGKGSVSLEDIHQAKLIVVAGQNPGTNHPRMLTALEEAKRERREDHRGQPAARGGPGPVQEPAEAARLGRSRHRARRPAPADPAQRRPRALPGDRRRCCSSGTPSTTTSSREHTIGFEEWAAHVARPRLGRRTARDRPRPASRSSEAAAMFRDSRGHRHLLGDGHHPAPQRGRHRSRRSSTSRCCRATSASRAPACARCAATPTCRATGPWASGSAARATSSTRSATSSASTRRASTASTRSSADRGAARRQGPRSSSRWAATSSRAAPDTEVTEAGDAQRRPHRARLHQAQPLARRPRPRGADPPGARPQRAGPHRRPRAAGHRRGLDVGGARLARPARAGVAST